MNCINHENVEAIFKCQDCDKSICKDCAVNNNGEVVCLQCAKERGLLVIKNEQRTKDQFYDNRSHNYNSYRRISTFLTTILSFIPGAGHMYLGFMTRGLHIMIAFFGAIVLSGLLYSANDILVYVSVVIWFFGVFECAHLRRKLQRGEELIENLFLDFTNKEINLYYIGIGLLVIGGLILLNIATDRVFFIFNISRPTIYYSIVKFVRSLFIPVALIVGGFWLLNRHRKNAQV